MHYILEERKKIQRKRVRETKEAREYGHGEKIIK